MNNRESGKLKDKIAIVTGGSQGIGEAICYSYAKEGATVIVVNKNNPHTGDAVVKKIIESGGHAKAMICDVADESSVKKLIAKVIKQYGKIDILVNNVGLAIFKKLEDQTLEDWNFVMNINLKGPFLLSREVVPHMKKQQYGKIIFISSTAASVGYETIIPYSASKGGLVAMAKSMVAELGRHKINVNIISPGSSSTLGNKFLNNQDFLDGLAQRTMSGAPMNPEDIAGAAVFLASDDAHAIHGIDLKVDNGWCAV